MSQQSYRLEQRCVFDWLFMRSNCCLGKTVSLLFWRDMMDYVGWLFCLLFKVIHQ